MHTETKHAKILHALNYLVNLERFREEVKRARSIVGDNIAVTVTVNIQGHLIYVPATLETAQDILTAAKETAQSRLPKSLR